jgi:hypothetical protein
VAQRSIIKCEYLIIGAGIAGLVLRQALSKSLDVVQLDPSPGGWKIGEANSPQLFSSQKLVELLPDVRKLPSFAGKNGSLFVGEDSAAAFPIISDRHSDVHVARDELEGLLIDRWDIPIRRERVESIDVEARVVETEKATYRVSGQMIDCSGGAMVVANALEEVETLWPISAMWKYYDVVGQRPGAFREQLIETGRPLHFIDIPNIDVMAPDPQ